MKSRLIPACACSLALGLMSGYWMARLPAAGPGGKSALPVISGGRPDTGREQRRKLPVGTLLKEMAGPGIWRADEAGLSALARLSAGEFETLADDLKEDLLHPYQKEMRDAFFRAWAVRAPEAALAFVEGQASSAMKEEMRIGIMRGWAASDLGGYLGWLDGQAAGPVLDEAVRIAIPQLVGVDPEAALGLSSKLPPHFRGSAYADIFSS